MGAGKLSKLQSSICILISSLFCLANKRGFGRNRDKADEFDQVVRNMVGDFIENPDKRRVDSGLFVRF